MSRLVELNAADGACIHARSRGTGPCQRQRPDHRPGGFRRHSAHPFRCRWIRCRRIHGAGAAIVRYRIELGIELACDDPGMARGRELVGLLGFDAPLRDVRAAADWLLAQGCGAVGVVGYCWGGAVAHPATRLGLPAAVSYYGRLCRILHERPQAPLLFHSKHRN